MFKIKKVLFIYLPVLVTAFFFGCNKDDTNIGIGIVPDKWKVNTIGTDTFRIKAYTYKTNNLKVGADSKFLLGNYSDPVFGEVKASFITDMVPPYKPSFTEFIFDSLVLYLRYDTIIKPYGDVNTSNEINVYKITTDLRPDTTYFLKDIDIPGMNPELVASSSYVPFNVLNKDSILAIKLDDSFGNEIVNDTANWVNTTYALLISPNLTSYNGAISIFNPFSNDTKVVVHYHTSTDTLEYTMSIGQSSLRLNLVEHNYDNSEFLPDFDNPENIEDTIVFVQGAGDLRTKITFPFLSELSKQGQWAVNMAEITIPSVQNESFYESEYPAPSNMELYRTDEKDSLISLNDLSFVSNSTLVYIGSGYFENKYIFDISSYIQELLDAKLSDNGIVILPKYYKVNPARVVLASGKNSNPIKLSLTLTKIK